MTKSEALEIVAIIRAAYPNGHFPAESARLYAELLSDLGFDQVTAAVKDRITGDSSGFLPTIGEIRSIVAQKLLGIPDPETAWGEVQAAIRKFGRYRTPEWSNPAIAAAVPAIGWETLCDSDTVGVERAHFIKIFAAYRGRSVREIATGGRPMMMSQASSGSSRLNHGG